VKVARRERSHARALTGGRVQWETLAAGILVVVAIGYFVAVLRSPSEREGLTPPPSAEEEPREVSPSDHAEVVAWLERRLAVAPPRLPWSLRSVEPDGPFVSIVLEIPPREAETFRSQRYTQQLVALRDAGCPDGQEPVWKLLKPGSAIWIRAETGGEEWLAVPCQDRRP